jgi:SAM-dependent methyltransferase
MIEQVLDGYAADAADLIRRYELLSSGAVLAPIADLLPIPPARVMDVGAGTGRDGAWLARRGHEVVAAEPVAVLREAGEALHPELCWVDDSLPRLARLRGSGERYDLVLLVGVWQHLPPETHEEAMAALADLLSTKGRLILSVRHGPGAVSRPCFPADVGHVCALAEARNLTLLCRRHAESLQQANRDAGVTWTWLAFEAP